MTLRGRDILLLVAPLLVWAVHFAGVYALVSASCAPRALIDVPVMQVAALAGTALAAALALAPLLRRPEDPGARTGLRWTALIAAATIVADGAYVFFFQSCGG